MVFIAEECLIAIMCPTCVYVFVALLVGLIVPQLVSLSFLYLIVFIPTIALSWGKYETRVLVLRFAIEDSRIFFILADNKAERIQVLVELVEQFVPCAIL